jgi:hypothetical protein
VSCTAPMGLEQLVAYWSKDLDAGAEAAVEEHLFACDTCFANAERVQRVVQAFRIGPPPVISQTELEALRAKGLTLGENSFGPGQGETVTFARGIDMLIHHLTGLDLTGAERVEVIVRSKSHGVIFEEPVAPFDRQRGEVLIACQRHFAAFPPDIVFDVRVHEPGTAGAIATYEIPHVFVP